MKSAKKNLSTRTLVLIAVAVLLFASGGFLGTRAALTIQSEKLDSEFELDHIYVQLWENDQHVGNRGDGTGSLIAYMNKKVDPGRVYEERIYARNDTGTESVSPVDQYVRLIIRKYWLDEEGNKDNTLDPTLIKLTYNNKEYNKGPWVRNDRESTTEAETYYYTSVLSGGAATAPVVNELQLDPKIIAADQLTKEAGKWVGNKQTYTYTYKYKGKYICIEAEVQALQTHNINRAIKSVWGVQNVSVSKGSLTVGQ